MRVSSAAEEYLDAACIVGVVAVASDGADVVMLRMLVAYLAASQGASRTEGQSQSSWMEDVEQDLLVSEVSDQSSGP